MTDHPHFDPDTGFAHLPLGALPSVHDLRQLQLATYLDLAALPTIPDLADLTLAVKSWPMYGNDRLGDCTVAAVGHMIQAWSAAVGAAVTPIDALIEEMYWLTGDPSYTAGQAGDPTDNGRVETDVLNFWRQTGITPGDPDKITAYVAVDPQNLANVRAAIYLFGGLYLGIALPITAQQQKVWDVVDPRLHGDSAPGSWGGHAVPHLAYKVGGHFKIVTWGGVLEMTEAFHKAYVEEAYAVLSPDWFKDGASPPGFDMAALTADLNAISTHPHPDPPPPPPPPGPTPASVTALLDNALKELSLTTVGMINTHWTTPPPQTHWRKALVLIAQARADVGKLVAGAQR